MECDRCRDELSARMDGELGLLEDAPVQEHVSGCADCQAWQAVATGLNRRLRVRAAVPVPDLVEPILVAAAVRPAQRVATGLLPQLALGLVGLGQLALGLSQLFGMRDGMDMGAVPAHDHLFNESTAWNLAVSAGLLVAALRPRLARGFVAPLAVFIAVLTAVSIGDLASGQVGAERLESHALLVVGLLLLILVDRRVWRVPIPASGRSTDRTDDDVLAGATTPAATLRRRDPAARRTGRHLGWGRRAA